MAKYQCGNRQCTDEELDQMEAIRSGKLKLADPSAPAASSGPAAGDDPKLKSMCELFPSLCQQVENMGNKVDELYGDRHNHPVPDEGLVDALVSADTECPECKNKVKNYVLPELAKRYGYTLATEQITAAPAPGPAATAADPQPSDDKTAAPPKDEGFLFAKG